MGKETPIVHFFHATWSGVVFLLISSFSILSTEAMIDRGNPQDVRPSIFVFWQLVDIWYGGYAGMFALAVLSAFFLWFCWTGIAFSFEAYKMHLDAMHKGAGGTFITVIGFLLAVDSYANWNTISSWPWPWYWQLTVTMGVSSVLMYMGHFSITHILKGIKGMKGGN